MATTNPITTVTETVQTAYTVVPVGFQQQFGEPPEPPFVLTPWNRDLGSRQGRIAIVGLRAIGTLKMITGALHFDGDAFTLPDGRNAPTTFEYDDDSVVGAGNIPIEFDSTMTEEEIRDATILAINNVDSALRISAFESPETPGIFVGLVNDNEGESGNQAIIENVSDPAFVTNGMRDGANPLDVVQGLVQAPEGEHVYVLGYELAGLFHRFAAGDFAQTEQEDDFGSTNIVRVVALIRSTDVMPSNLAWRFSLLLDGVAYTTRLLEPKRDRALVDVAANVSKLIGLHTLGFRLDLVSV